MRYPSTLAALAAAVVGLAACVSDAPLQLPNDHPASPTAATGVIDTPDAIASYKSPNDFAARSAADADAQVGGGNAGMHHGSGGMAGMQHDSMAHGATPGMNHGGSGGMDRSAMPGMQHGGAPYGAESR